MKYISEKEKKLEDALKKLKKLDLKNDQISGNIKELSLIHISEPTRPY